MTIIGQSQTGTIIDAEKQGRIFTINPGISVTLQNMTLQNGTTTGFGGAIYNYGNLTVTGCTFIGNTASGLGGAILNEDFTGFILKDSTFTYNNAAFNGGAIANWGDNSGSYTVNIENCTFTNNNAWQHGGAIFNWNIYGSITINITKSTFTGNNANSGGAIYNDQYLNAHFNRFYNNTASYGNAIFNFFGTVDAENNWWGTNNPDWSSLIYQFSAPNWWIYMNLTANTTNPLYGDTVNLTANFNYLYNGTSITPLTTGHIPDNIVNFASNDGNLNPQSKTTIEGLASSMFIPTKAGSVTVNATLDNQICSLIFNVKGISSVSVDSVHNFAGQTVNLTANIVDQNGNPINQGQVTFKVGNAAEITVTVLNGIARIDNWTIPATWNVGNYTILVNYLENSNYTASSGTGNLTIDQTPTNLTIDNVTGNKGKTVTLNATLTDYYGIPLNNRIVEFYINNVKVGENSTDTNGIAIFNYNITQVGGIYNIAAKFLGNSGYLVSTCNGTLKVNQSCVYVNVTASKNNPTAGETIILTFKLGNNGPDPADDVVFTYVIPEGIKFVSIETEPGYPQATYNATTRTVTWPLGTVPKLDPWIKLNILVLNPGAFNVIPGVNTSTYDPNLGSNIQQITINAVQAASATSVTGSTRTIGMQKTGMPINYLILAILAVFGGLLTSKKF